MATSDDIKAWLVTNVPTTLASLTTPKAPQAYAGQSERHNAAVFDCRVQFLFSVDLQRDIGLIRHAFQVEAKIIGHEHSEEDVLSVVLESASRLLIAAYDGQVSTVQAAIPGSSFERVRCFRESPINVDKSTKTPRRSIVVSLQFDEWRS